MAPEIRSMMKLISKAKTEDEIVAILDAVIEMHKTMFSPYWWEWKLDELVRSCRQYKQWKENIVYGYAEQFIFYLFKEYMDMSLEERTVEKFHALISGIFAFDTRSNLYKLIFECDEMLMDWLIKDESELDNNFINNDTGNDKFYILKNAIESGTGHGAVILNEIEKVRKHLEIFAGLHNRIEELYAAAQVGMTVSDYENLVKNQSHPEFLYKCGRYYYSKKYENAPEDDKPVIGWQYLLESEDSNAVYWGIKNVFKYVFAKNQIKLNKKFLGKIFRFKKCQCALYNTPEFNYAIPEMIEYAASRKNKDSLCVEFKQILGYVDEDGNEIENGKVKLQMS